MNRAPDEEEWMVGSMEEDEENNSGSHPRKKLRLTKEQSHLLEQSFRQNHTLNPVNFSKFSLLFSLISQQKKKKDLNFILFLFQKQKETLAEVLKLKPRQVEVWFQNRRARWVNLIICFVVEFIFHYSLFFLSSLFVFLWSLIFRASFFIFQTKLDLD